MCRYMPKEYCPWCEQEQPIIETVAWQDNACQVCNQAIPEDGIEQSDSESITQ